MKLNDRAPDWVGTNMIRCGTCGRVDDYKYYAPFVHQHISKWTWECDLCQVARRLEGDHESDVAHGFLES